MDADRPVDGQNVPCSHSGQVACAALLLANEPKGQGAHTLAPAAAYTPTPLQAAHTPADEAPCEAEKLPKGHSWQDDAPATSE
jgi:hypothetical protein